MFFPIKLLSFKFFHVWAGTTDTVFTVNSNNLKAGMQVVVKEFDNICDQYTGREIFATVLSVKNDEIFNHFSIVQISIDDMIRVEP